MVDDDSSHGGTDATARDGRRTATENIHPLPWRTLDYGAADRIDDIDDTAHDSEVPVGADTELTARTGFDPSDLPPEKREHWEWLKRLQDGVGEQDRAVQQHEADIARDLDTFASQLGATDRQQERAEWLLDHVDIKAEVIPQAPIEVAVLAALSLAMDEDRTRAARDLRAAAGGSDAPQVTSVLRDEAFEQLCADLDVDRTAVKRARQRLRETDLYESPNERS